TLCGSECQLGSVSAKCGIYRIGDRLIPTHNQIAAEDRRRRTLIDKVPHMNDLDAVEKELRYHEVLSRVNGVAALSPAVMQMLQSLALIHGQQNLIQVFQGHQATLKGLQQGQNLANERIDSLFRVISGRSRNQHIKRRDEMNEHSCQNCLLGIHIRSHYPSKG
ncbi:myoglobin, partial [Striga asiatica]